MAKQSSKNGKKQAPQQLDLPTNPVSQAEELLSVPEDQSWNTEQVQELEEDAKWDGSNNIPAPISTTEDDNSGWTEAVAAQGEPGEDHSDVDVAEDWESVPVPLTLNIVRHSGKFNPDEAKIMIFGETGTQKTRTASTFPTVLFADIDHGMSSVTEQVDKVTIDDSDRGFQQLKALYEYLKTMDHGYTTVVLDTLNEMQRVIMRFTVEEYTHIRRSYGNLPGQSDYGKMLYEFTELVRDFISLPMRVVLLAQVKPQEFDSDVIVPQLIGKNTVRELMRKMDIVGYIYKADGETGTVPEISFDSPQYATKDRSNRLPATLPHPTWARMAAYWK